MSKFAIVAMEASPSLQDMALAYVDVERRTFVVRASAARVRVMYSKQTAVNSANDQNQHCMKPLKVIVTRKSTQGMCCPGPHLRPQAQHLPLKE